MSSKYPESGVLGLGVAIVVFFILLANGVPWPFAILGGMFWPATVVIYLLRAGLS